MARFRFISTSVLALLLVLLTPTSPNPTDKNQSVNGAKKSFIERRDELISLYSAKGKTFEMRLTRDYIFYLDTISAKVIRSHCKSRPVIDFEGDRPTTNKEGTFKEYLGLLSNDIMDPKLDLFYSDAIPKFKRLKFSHHVNYNRFPNCPDMIAKFVPNLYLIGDIFNLQCIGNVIGMAILNKQFMDVTFEDDLYKMISGKKIPQFIIDVNGKPNAYFKSTKVGRPPRFTYSPPNVNEENADKDNAFGLTFSNEEEMQEALSMIEEYDENHALISIAALCQGIFEVIPRDALGKFSKDEIQMLISGDSRELQLSDWHHFSAIKSDNDNNLQSILWFWEYIQGAKKLVHYQLLSFITGTSRLPLGVLVHNDNIPMPKPYINIILLNKMDSVPTSDPYTNTLYLPSYSSHEVFKTHMDLLIKTMPGIPTWMVSSYRR